MATRIAAFDWARTPLGPRDGWPPSLRTAADICLNSRFPMFLWWGPRLINLYNDAYAPILGGRHPDALGRPAADLWREVWSVVGPEVEAVLAGGPASWAHRVPLTVERNGFAEEAYFTWSHGPVRDEGGAVAGVLCVVTEDTASVRAERERDRLADQARAILESITDAFFALDRDWRFAYANPQAERVLGRAPGDLLGKVIWDEYPGLRGTAFEAAYRRAAADREPATATAFYPDHDRWYEVRAYPAAGGGASVYFRDVTDAKRDEERLRRSHETFYNLIQNDPFGVYVVDADFRLRQVSLGAQKVFERVPRPLLGRDFDEVLRAVWPEPFASEAVGRFRHTLRTGEPFASPGTVERRRDLGVVEAYDWRIERVGLPDGRFGVVCYFYDLGERQRWEAALRESEQRLVLAQSAARLGTWELDLQTGQAVWSDGIWHLLELTPGDGQPSWDRWLAHLHPDDRARAADEFHRQLAAGQPEFYLEFRVVTAGRGARWLASQGRVVSDAAGRPVRALGANLDITERKLAEDALRESEERLRLGLDAGNTGTWDWDIPGDTVTWSDRVYEFHGVAPGTFAGRVAEFAKLIHPADAGRVRAAIDDAIARRTPYAAEFRALRPDGAVRWLSTKGKVYYAPDGRPLRMLGATTDVTDRRQGEEERERLLAAERAARARAEALAAQAEASAAEAARASRTKDEFLATLSHELRTPLNAILGWSHILARAPHVEAEVTEGLRVIERNARAQAQIIGDLLDMSRIDAGKVRLDVRPVDLAAVVGAAADTVRPAAAAKRLDLRVEVGAAADVPLTGDPDRLQQVFWNLLANAVKFTPPGGRVRVTLSRVGPHVRVAVADTGEGVRPDFLPHVFERFRQADATTTRRHGGLGLGLSIVKQLVELHGGTVHAESPGVGLGSILTVSLPLADGAEPAGDGLGRPAPPGLPALATSGGGVAAAAAVAAATAGRPQELASTRVLVVEDEPDAADLVRRVLEARGAVVAVAASAAEAAARLAAERPDVLVSDVGLPGEDGYSLIRRVRSLGPGRGGDVPAVALTAYAGADDRERAASAGFDRHLAKPVEPAELAAVVATLAARRRSD